MNANVLITAAELQNQLVDLLADKRLTIDQLGSAYSIRRAKAVTVPLKEISPDPEQPIRLIDFLKGLPEVFRVDGFYVSLQANAAVLSGNGQLSLGGVPIPHALLESSDANRQALQLKYSDVSRCIQNILKEARRPMEIPELERVFLAKYSCTIQSAVSSPALDYLSRKQNIFEVDVEHDPPTVYLTKSLLSGPPMADPNIPKDERFVVSELVQLITDSADSGPGPVCYISSLCGKFIQRNGISVTSIINARPLDLFKRHAETFMLIGGGNVTLRKYQHTDEVQRYIANERCAAAPGAPAPPAAAGPVKTPAAPAAPVQQPTRLTTTQPAPPQAAQPAPPAAAKKNEPPLVSDLPPEKFTEQLVVEEFVRLIRADSTPSVYISSLCGRFLQRYGVPVSNIITCRPADFLRKYPDTFVMTGGGNVGLREVLGETAENVPAPPPRETKKQVVELKKQSMAYLNSIALTDATYSEIHARIANKALFTGVIAAVQSVVDVLQTNSWLLVKEVVRAGAVGKGLITTETPDVSIVLFVKQMPKSDHARWLVPVLEALTAILEIKLPRDKCTDFRVEPTLGSVCFKLAPSAADSVATAKETQVTIQISPEYNGREDLLEHVRNTPPAQRMYYSASFVKEQVDFVNAQPQVVKTLMRLVKYWAARQHWSSAFTTPSPYLLELVCVYAHQQIKSSLTGGGGSATTTPTMGGALLGGGVCEKGLAQLVERVFEIFRNFETVKVLWADTGAALYKLSDIWRPLLSHEPLFMDPSNPYCNLADANFFDSRQLVAFAQLPGCFDCFRREASKIASLVHNAQQQDSMDGTPEEARSPRMGGEAEEDYRQSFASLAGPKAHTHTHTHNALAATRMQTPSGASAQDGATVRMSHNSKSWIDEHSSNESSARNSPAVPTTGIIGRGSPEKGGKGGAVYSENRAVGW